MDAPRRDLHRLIATNRRRVARAPAQMADHFSRVLHRTPDARLERLMRSPARRMILEGIFWQMPQFLDRRRATGVNAAVLWRIAGRPNGATDDFRLTIAHGRAHVVRGSSGEPPVVTMTMGDVDFLRLVTGTLDPMHAYFGGKIELSGDIMFAAKLGGLFRVPAAPRPQS